MTANFWKGQKRLCGSLNERGETGGVDLMTNDQELPGTRERIARLLNDALTVALPTLLNATRRL